MSEEHAKIEEIFMKCYEEQSDALFRFCYFQVSNREVATDILQDTFTKTWIYLKDGKKIDNLKAFLYQVAKNLIIDYRRKKKAVSLEAITETGIEFKEDDDLKEKIFHEDEKGFVLDKISQLDEEDREILTLRYVNEMSIKEISETLGITTNNTSVKIHRAVEKMKDILEKYYKD